MKLTKFLMVVAITCCLIVNVCIAQTLAQEQSLKFITSIPLPNVKGRIDHLAIDIKHKIVFVAALGNNTVEIVDLNSKKVIHTLTGYSEPQGIIYIPKSNSVFVSNGGNGECNVFNASTYKNTSTVKLPGDADNVRYDSTANKIYVGYGDGGIAIIDATNFKLISEIQLSGHPESFQIAKTSKKIFVNVPNSKQIEVVDLSVNKVTEKWMITDATSNFPMCLDEAGDRLYIGCRKPAMLLIIDVQSGKTISSVNINKDIDDLFYDAGRDILLLSCGVEVLML